MKIKMFIFCLLIIGLCQFQLYPGISSRIEGTVLDKETGLPIEGAWVSLFKCTNPIFKDCCFSLPDQETDNTGKFRFDGMTAGQYFLVIVHREYLVYGPVYEVLEHLMDNTRFELRGRIPRGLRPMCLKNKPERNFILEEGKIKHFVIKLEKAAILEVNAKTKLPSGTSVTKREVDVYLIDPVDGKQFFGIGFYNGSFKSRCLPPFGNVTLLYKTAGYARSKITGLNLRPGQTERVDILFDFTTGPIVHGFIKSKQKKYGLQGIDISLFEPKVGGSTLETTTVEDGEFWFAGMKPGEYTLCISAQPLLELPLTINPNEKIEITRELLEVE